MKRPTLALVLGVHRSGTSLLAAGVVAAGFGAGDFGDSRDDDNPEGYFEHPQVRQFNDRLLAHLGASWDNWGFHAPSAGLDGPALAQWRDEAADLLRRIFAGPGPFVLKDPRCLTLLPFWQAVVPAAGFALRRVMILRDPAEVAESQRQRAERRPGSFPLLAEPEPMAALWTVTMQGALTTLADGDTLLVGHAGLMADPAGTVAAVAAHLGQTPDPAALRAFAQGHVRPDLYRARAGRGPQGIWLREAAGLFRALVRDGLPRVLSVAEAQAIVAGRRRLPGLIATLPAVSAMVRSMQADRQRILDAQEVAALRQLVWGLGAALARKTPDDALAALHDKVAAMIGDDTRDVAVLVAMARIEQHRRRWDAAEAWLHRLVRAHPANPLGPQLLAGLADRRRAAGG